MHRPISSEIKSPHIILASLPASSCSLSSTSFPTTNAAIMSRTFCVPAVFFLFAAFVLLFIVSISLPFLTAMDITRVHTNGTIEVAGNEEFSQLRVSEPYQFPLGSVIDTTRPCAALVGYMVRRLPFSPRVLTLSPHRSYCYTALNGNVVCSSTGLSLTSPSLLSRSSPYTKATVIRYPYKTARTTRFTSDPLGPSVSPFILLVRSLLCSTLPYCR